MELLVVMLCTSVTSSLRYRSGNVFHYHSADSGSNPKSVKLSVTEFERIMAVLNSFGSTVVDTHGQALTNQQVILAHHDQLLWQIAETIQCLVPPVPSAPSPALLVPPAPVQ